MQKLDTQFDSTLFITIDDLRVSGKHGHYESERRVEQEFLVSLVVELEQRDACTSDALRDTVDYDGLKRVIVSIFHERSRYLLESLAETICSELLSKFPLVSVDVCIRKLAVWKDGVPGVRMIKKRLTA